MIATYLESEKLVTIKPGCSIIKKEKYHFNYSPLHHRAANIRAGQLVTIAPEHCILQKEGKCAAGRFGYIKHFINITISTQCHERHLQVTAG
jgi:hypothetical protein